MASPTSAWPPTPSAGDEELKLATQDVEYTKALVADLERKNLQAATFSVTCSHFAISPISRRPSMILHFRNSTKFTVHRIDLNIDISDPSVAARASTRLLSVRPSEPIGPGQEVSVPMSSSPLPSRFPITIEASQLSVIPRVLRLEGPSDEPIYDDARYRFMVDHLNNARQWRDRLIQPRQPTLDK